MNLVPSIFYSQQKKHLNLWWQGSLVLAIFLVLTTTLALFDQRSLADEALWIKPIKFEIALIIHFITLAMLAAFLSPIKRESKMWKGMTYAVVAAGLFEALYIFLQAARGRESHYNNSTAIESVMYGLMGLGAVTLVVGSFYLGYLLYREYQPRHNNILLLSAALGLTIGSVLTLVIAGYLSSPEGKYLVDTSMQDTLRLPIFSWYLNGQDLRIPHFFATHMMQLIPLYGLWLSRKNISFNKSKVRLLWCTGTYSLLVIVLFVMAIL